MEMYNIHICGESTYDFNVKLSNEELKGVLKVLKTCNELGDYNDAFTVTKCDTKEELLSWM